MQMLSRSYVDLMLSSFATVIEQIRDTKRYTNAMLDDASRICKAMMAKLLDGEKYQRRSDSMPFEDLSNEKLIQKVKDSLDSIKKLISDKLWWTKFQKKDEEANTQAKRNEVTKLLIKHAKLIGKTCHIDTNTTNKPIFPTHNTNQQFEPTKYTNQMSKPTHNTNVTLDLSSS